MSVFLILGLVFTLTGLIHKDKWKKKKLSSREKRLQIILLIVGLVMFLVMGIVYWWLKVGV